MKFDSRKFTKVGKIQHFEISAADVCSLATNPEHAYPGQRDHANGFKKKTYLRGVLDGETQTFTAAYIKTLKRFELMDGYHRGHGVSLGAIQAHPDYPYYLKVHTVEDRAASNRLFEQINSLSAAKKSTCWFQSGLNECGVLNLIQSHLVMGMGKATAVQFAAGLRGSAFTKQATISVIDGIKFVDGLGLRKHKHEFGGSIGVYYAVAKHCSDKGLAERFIRNINDAVFDLSHPTKGDKIVEVYHDWLVTNENNTGGVASESAFSQGLAAFARFAYTEKRKAKVPTQVTMNLSQFIEFMRVL